MEIENRPIPEEQFDLVSQMRRAIKAAPALLAELTKPANCWKDFHVEPH